MIKLQTSNSNGSLPTFQSHLQSTHHVYNFGLLAKHLASFFLTNLKRKRIATELTRDHWILFYLHFIPQSHQTQQIQQCVRYLKSDKNVHISCNMTYLMDIHFICTSYSCLNLILIVVIESGAFVNVLQFWIVYCIGDCDLFVNECILHYKQEIVHKTN